MRTAMLGISIVFVVSITLGLHAQQPRGGERQIVQRSDIPGTSLEAVAAVHTWEPHTATSWHTHPGEMVGFVTEGAVVIQQRGRPTLMVKAGESFLIPADVAHDTLNTTDRPAQMFVTYIVPKNQGLSRGAPQ
jgi:quercetin dioxygenase-like cupin family protein